MPGLWHLWLTLQHLAKSSGSKRGESEGTLHLEREDPCPQTGSTTHRLCGLRHVTSPLRASVVSSRQDGMERSLLHGL